MDQINPDHYKKQCSLECIEVMELYLGTDGLINFCLGAAFKYLWRYENKGKLQDLMKADWYVSKVYELNMKDEKFMYTEKWENLKDLVDEKVKGEVGRHEEITTF